ncbi:kinase-like domain-containing protein [Cubamyces lactineus]|nr:kinase-like domain-containing protein [Cubamyces lactineus]
MSPRAHRPWLSDTNVCLVCNRSSTLTRAASHPRMSQPTAGQERQNLRGDVFAELSQSEVEWQERQPFLESHGYMLRPRYRPGWIPSWWRNPGQRAITAEDRLSDRAWRPHIMDARRMSDGKLVLIKMIHTGSPEQTIATYLSSPELRQDPRNHCVPILDVIHHPDNPDTSYLIMPYLRKLDDPEFESIDEIMDFGEQVLEGLVFLHDHGVAHRDCAYQNVMLDAEAMYPEGFHPMADDCLPDKVTTFAPYISRSQAHAVYYFIDFGISSRFEPDDTQRLVLGSDGLDQEVPELSDTIAYDPFKVDIFIMGNMFLKTLLQKYSNMDMIIPLVRQMRQHDPNRRPSAVEALRHWKVIRRHMWRLQRFWRPRLREESICARVINDSLSLCRVLYTTLP